MVKSLKLLRFNCKMEAKDYSRLREMDYSGVNIESAYKMYEEIKAHFEQHKGNGSSGNGSDNVLPGGSLVGLVGLLHPLSAAPSVQKELCQKSPYTEGTLWSMCAKLQREILNYSSGLSRSPVKITENTPDDPDDSLFAWFQRLTIDI